MPGVRVPVSGLVGSRLKANFSRSLVSRNGEAAGSGLLPLRPAAPAQRSVGGVGGERGDVEGVGFGVSVLNPGTGGYLGITLSMTMASLTSGMAGAPGQTICTCRRPSCRT